MVDNEREWSRDATSAYREYLVRSQHAMLRIMLFAVAPISIIVNLRQYFADPCWQFLWMLGFGLVTVALWGVSYLLFLRNRVNASAWLLVISVNALIGTSMPLVEGNDISSILGLTVILAYTAAFSRRLLLTCTALFAGFVVISQAITFLQLIEPKVWQADTRALTAAFYVVLMVPGITFLLFRNSNASNQMLGALRGQSAVQRHSVATAATVARNLNNVVNQLGEVSSNHAAQAEQLGAATAEISASISELKQIAQETASSASASRTTADSIHTSTRRGTQKLQAVETGFTDFVQRNDSVRGRFGELVSLVERIEEIIQTNREIAAQIKILAINASIQAAKAGEYGRGFRVVADELQALIKRTDESLKHSRRLLESIREHVRDSVSTLEQGSGLLQQNFGELKSTGQSINEITEAFNDSARKIELIALSANEQQLSLEEVSLGMGQIDTAVSQINASVSTLRGCVDEISQSSQLLGDALQRAEG